MASKYFVWKDPNCNGVNPEWIQITRNQFNLFVNEPMNIKRKFIKVPIDPDHKSKGYYIMEATLDGFRKWDAERKKAERSSDILDFPRRKYKDKTLPSYCDEISSCEPVNEVATPDNATSSNRKKRQKPEIMCLVSMEECVDEEEELTLHDTIADPNVDVEKDVIKRIQLETVFNAADMILTVTEKKVFNAVYRNNRINRTLTEIAEDFGCSQQNISKIIAKVEEKLRKEVVKS